MITVVFHNADYDGLFCKAIAEDFLAGVEDVFFTGWDHGDPRLQIPEGNGPVYVMDLPVDKPFGFEFQTSGEKAAFAVPCGRGDAYVSPQETMAFDKLLERVIWIDHHKTAIESHPDLKGYRIEGVAACRLVYQWFIAEHFGKSPKMPTLQLPGKREFVDRNLNEPFAVRLAGEYDVWDHRDSRAELFQFGLDSEKEIKWAQLLENNGYNPYIKQVVEQGEFAMACIKKREADVMRSRSFLCRWEGLTWLCLNTAKCNSRSFEALDKKETGHDALMALYWDGICWYFSLYQSEHRKDLDLSAIAAKYGGGGHPGACGFYTTNEKAGIEVTRQHRSVG